ncbi:MAG: lysophospholipid acyltransferase family protein [Planctomycetota bacterium]
MGTPTTAEIAVRPRKPRSRFRKALSRYSGYALLVALHAVVSRLPLALGRALARLAGSIAYRILPRSRELALENLRAALGRERSEAEIRAIARAAFRNAAISVVEWAILRRWKPERLLREFPEVCEVIDRLEADVRSTGSGVVGITGHFGNWEVLSLFFGRHKPGFLVPVANRVYFHRYQEFFHRMRTGCGLEVVYSDESPRRIVRAIQRGAVGAFLPDADVRTNSGIFVEFFGRPTYTVAFPMQLARRLGVSYLLAFLARDGSRFRLDYSGLRSAPRTDDEERDVAQATQEWTRLLEEEIRRDPSQWAWMQPRWRSTPESPRRRAGHGVRREAR